MSLNKLRKRWFALPFEVCYSRKAFTIELIKWLNSSMWYRFSKKLLTYSMTTKNWQQVKLCDIQYPMIAHAMCLLVASPRHSGLRKDSLYWIQMSWQVKVGNVNYVTSTSFMAVWEHTLFFNILQSYTDSQITFDEMVINFVLFQFKYKNYLYILYILYSGNFPFVIYLNSWCKELFYRVRL